MTNSNRPSRRMIQITIAQKLYGLHPQSILALARRGRVRVEDRWITLPNGQRSKRWHVNPADVRREAVQATPTLSPYYIANCRNS